MQFFKICSLRAGVVLLSVLIDIFQKDFLLVLLNVRIATAPFLPFLYPSIVRQPSMAGKDVS